MMIAFPFRAISEALGTEVQWDAASRTITASQQNTPEAKTVVMLLGNPLITVNGQTIPLPVAPYETRKLPTTASLGSFFS